MLVCGLKLSKGKLLLNKGTGENLRCMPWWELGSHNLETAGILRSRNTLLAQAVGRSMMSTVLGSKAGCGSGTFCFPWVLTMNSVQSISHLLPPAEGKCGTKGHTRAQRESLFKVKVLLGRSREVSLHAR